MHNSEAQLAVDEFLRFADARCLLNCTGRMMDGRTEHTPECLANRTMAALVCDLDTENKILQDNVQELHDRMNKKKK